MRITLLPSDLATEIIKVIQRRSSDNLISGDTLLYIPRELFGTTLEVSRINGDFVTMDGWSIPPWFVDEVHTE